MSIKNHQISKEVASELNYNIAQFQGIETESPEAMYAMAEAFRSKGNYFLAAKFFMMASTFDMPNSSYERHYQDCTKADNTDQISGDTEDHKFDFLCVPGGNTGSSIVSHALAWHPQISAPPKSNVDQAVHDHTLKSLLAQSTHFSQLSDKHRHGIVQHNYIVGNSLLLEQEQWPIKLNNLREVVKGDTFYQIVRDPIDNVRSSLRRETIAIAQQWWDASGQINVVRPTKLLKAPKSPIKVKLKNRFKDKVLKQSFNNQEFIGFIDQYKIGTEYQKAFKDWQVIDVSEFSPPQISTTLSSLYSKLGVDNDFDSPLLQTPQNTNINRIMYSSWVRVDHKGYGISLGLYFADLASFSMDFPFVELAWRNPCEEWLEAGLPNHRLALTCNYQFWANLPLEIRQEIVKSEELQRILDNVIYPLILGIAKKTFEASADIYSFIEQEYLSLYAKEVISTQRSSIEKLIEEHPHLAEKWHRYSDLFKN